mmetsp:Transcript_789/g.1972  ORF Transcript_789/g.1972 Transcript_789/m.1972 type:complete len:390 (+) Transcript_789:81-1250(+)
MVASRSFCVVCGRPAVGCCSVCQSVHYCSKTCQQLDWLEEHASLCEDLHARLPQLKETEADHSAVALWRLAVSKLWQELYEEEDLEDLEELDVLLAEAEEVHQGTEGKWRQARCELLSFGSRPVLVTAPHCMALLRDGQSPHLVEKHTVEIAAGLAQHLEGSCLAWAAKERRRTELLWRLSKRVNEERGLQDIRDGHLLDPRNRDPNFLATWELETNSWFRHMRSKAEMWGPEALHVDVHGCQDPPNTPSHLTIGLGALCFRALETQKTGNLEAFDSAMRFGQALCEELTLVLQKAHLAGHLRPKAPLVRLAAPGPGDEDCPRFSGAWRGNRQTQSQQAVFAGFSHAVQLELSKALRAVLAADGVLLAGFGSALRTAWVQAKQSQRLRA